MPSVVLLIIHIIKLTIKKPRVITYTIIEWEFQYVCHMFVCKSEENFQYKPIDLQNPYMVSLQLTLRFDINRSTQDTRLLEISSTIFFFYSGMHSQTTFISFLWRKSYAVLLSSLRANSPSLTCRLEH